MNESTDALRIALRDLRRLLLGREETPRPKAAPTARRRRLMPVVVPAVLLALLGLTVAAAQYLDDVRDLQDWAAILGIGSTLPPAVALRSPIWGWRLSYLMLFAGAAGALPSESWPWNPVQIIGFLIVFALVGIRTETGVAVWAGVLTLLPVFLLVPTRANAYGVTVLVSVILILADQVRRRRRSQQALSAQAEVSELEKARRAVLEERTRIAREMHDVVAHHMSMIAVQAETAPYRLDSLPEPARAEFAAIAGSARGALTDMRRLLGVLRSDTASVPTAPQPRLADVADLVAAARRAGMTVTLEQDPPPDGAPVPPEAVGLTTYRIVQEALANAARHAPGAAVRIAVRPGGRELALRVENGPVPTASRRDGPGGDEYSAPARHADPDGHDGPEEGADRKGHGLTGMRERARLHDGTFAAGPADGGYAVVVHLPYDAGFPTTTTGRDSADDREEPRR